MCGREPRCFLKLGGGSTNSHPPCRRVACRVACRVPCPSPVLFECDTNDLSKLRSEEMDERLTMQCVRLSTFAQSILFIEVPWCGCGSPRGCAPPSARLDKGIEKELKSIEKALKTIEKALKSIKKALKSIEQIEKALKKH